MFLAVLKPNLVRLSTLALAASLGACGLMQPASMSLPNSLQAGQATKISGIGGGETGRFSFGANGGSFSRSATRLSFFDVYTLRDGGAKFTASGPSFGGDVDAACRMKQRTVAFDFVEFRPVPMAYACEFQSGGQAMRALFELQASERGLSNREDRRGRMMLDGAVFDIRSVHDLEGGALPVAAPIGYVFERKGVAIGGVEINGEPRVFEAAGASEADRKAMFMAALALSVFWDPALVET